MSRQLMAILVSSALVFGSVTNAVAAPANTSPLPAGQAAGIKQAQASQIDPLLALGIVTAIFIAGVLLIGDSTDDDDASPATTGSF